MEQMKNFANVVEEFEDRAKFLIVYTEEAHPVETKHCRGNIEVRQHKIMEERAEAARTFIKEIGGRSPCPIVLDNIANEAVKAYAAFPERLFIIKNGLIAYEGGAGPFWYDIQDMKEKLLKLI